MDRFSLAILKGEKSILIKGEVFNANTFYRFLDYSETHVMIYGVIFSKIEFDEKFEFAYDKVIRDWTNFGLIKPNGKVISKSAFNKVLDVHCYKTNSKYIGFIMNSRQIIYGFYHNRLCRLKDLRELAYNNFVNVIKGDVSALDNFQIQFWNFG